MIASRRRLEPNELHRRVRGLPDDYRFHYLDACSAVPSWRYRPPAPLPLLSPAEQAGMRERAQQAYARHRKESGPHPNFVFFGVAAALREYPEPERGLRLTQHQVAQYLGAPWPPQRDELFPEQQKAKYHALARFWEHLGPDVSHSCRVSENDRSDRFFVLGLNSVYSVGKFSLLSSLVG